MKGLRSISALMWALEKAGVRWRLFILSPLMGTPENPGVTLPFRPHLGPGEGNRAAATEAEMKFYETRRGGLPWMWRIVYLSIFFGMQKEIGGHFGS